MSTKHERFAVRLSVVAVRSVLVALTAVSAANAAEGDEPFRRLTTPANWVELGLYNEGAAPIAVATPRANNVTFASGWVTISDPTPPAHVVRRKAGQELFIAVRSGIDKPPDYGSFPIIDLNLGFLMTPFADLIKTGITKKLTTILTGPTPA